MLMLGFFSFASHACKACESRALRTKTLEKLIFSAFPDGRETLYTQCMLFGYLVGNPGLVKVLFTTEPHPINQIVALHVDLCSLNQ